MQNLNKINSKLQYEEFVYKFNDFLVKQNVLGIYHDLNELFHVDFEKYMNTIIRMCMTRNYVIPTDMENNFHNLVQDNFDVINFDLIDKSSRTDAYFKKYILNTHELLSNFKMFLYTIKFGGFSQKVLNQYLDTFIQHNILTDKQLDKIFMFIAAYIDIYPTFINKYIMYFSTPKNAYVLKLYCKHFYDCDELTVNKLMHLANTHIYGEKY